MTRTSLIALAASALGAQPAAADSPRQPTSPRPVRAAEDHNLENENWPDGITLSSALGLGLTLGIGIEGGVGTGGSLSFRVADMATTRVAVTAEVAATFVRHAVKGSDGTSSAKDNSSGHALFGAQLYLSRSAWLRIAGGVGTYAANDVGDVMKVDVKLSGLTGLFGAGIDLVRRWRLGIGIEFFAASLVGKGGALECVGILTSVNFD